MTQLDARTAAFRLDRPLGNLPGGGNEGDRISVTIANGGPGGGGYTRTIKVLQRDANRAGEVVNSFGDLAFVRARHNRRADDAAGTGARYTPWADVNADGQINSFGDLAGVRARLNDAVPPATAASAGLFREASLLGHPYSEPALVSAFSATRDLFGSGAIA